MYAPAVLCVGNPRNTTVFLAVSALKPLPLEQKFRHFLYFQTSPKRLNQEQMEESQGISKKALAFLLDPRYPVGRGTKLTNEK